MDSWSMENGIFLWAHSNSVDKAEAFLQQYLSFSWRHFQLEKTLKTVQGSLNVKARFLNYPYLQTSDKLTWNLQI